MIPDSVTARPSATDLAKAIAHRVNDVIEWKIAYDQRAEAKFHRKRRAARRRRRQRADRRRVLLSRLVSWAR